MSGYLGKQACWTRSVLMRGLLFTCCACGTVELLAQQNVLRPNGPTSATAPTPAPRAAAKSGPTEATADAPQARSIANQMADAYALSKTAKTVDEYSSIIETCERVIAETPKLETIKYARELAGWAYNRRGEAYVQQAGDLAAKGEDRQANELDTVALEDFQQAIAHDKTKWKAYHNRGVSLGLHGKLDEALADFNEALRLNPRHINGWFNRGEIRSQLHQYGDAIEDYSKALQLKPDDHGSLLGRAAARRNLGQYPEAMKDVSLALQYQSQNAVLYCERADILMALGQWQNAAEDYRTSAKLDNSLGRAFRGVAWLMATCPELKFRNAQLAFEAAEKAIALEGDNDYRALDVLAAAQANLGQFNEAQVTLRKAMEIAPQEVQPTLQLRLRLYANGQPYREPVRQAAAPARLPR